VNNSIQFFIIYVPSQQLKGQKERAECSLKRVLEANHNNQETNEVRGNKVKH
jgi:hypothetical protein